MEYDSDDLEDGPVLKYRPTSTDMVKFNYLRDGLRAKLSGTCTYEWQGHQNSPSVIGITFRRPSPYWAVEFKISLTDGWATVHTSFMPTFDVEYTAAFTQRDVCLGHIIQMCDTCAKICSLGRKMHLLKKKLGPGAPVLEPTVVKGEHYPYAIMNMTKAGAMKTMDRVSIHFINEHEAWPDRMWARVDLSNATSTTVYCPDEREAFNLIVSSMDTGARIDYYALIE